MTILRITIIFTSGRNGDAFILLINHLIKLYAFNIESGGMMVDLK